ncbi:alkyl hydroperoxide reductase subunit F [Methanomicrobium sp. W14]|uniref:FAD-dependent oxidoreductase n=1 Tax=Methanomicrobium sp. W14 TaxID=2817839 RepID=UPI001AE945B3|nr:FAD-dependent oxidoreductase [Methanomicrobium sp. W14]MBP2134286.1 alkyl hydroperoxide reductase subunit F [Methanomicrobium sp. W14]
MAEVKVYSTKMCQYCRLLKAYLDRHHVSYTNIDVGEDVNAAKEMVDLTGQYAVPVTVVGDEVIIGFDTKRLNELFGEEEAPEIYDVLVLGGGPAGLTAAMYSSRKMLSCMIITENIGGQALESWSIENYMGFRIITGGELMQKFENQIKSENIRVEPDSVSEVSEKNSLFEIKTVSGQVFKGKSLIITTGVKPRWLGVENEDKFIGRGISVCSTCDGPLFKGKDIAIVGGGNYAVTTAIEMSSVAKKVYLIVRSRIKADEAYMKQFKAKENIETFTNYEISALLGDKRLDSIKIREKDTGNEKKIDVSGIFLAIGHDPNTSFLDGFVDLNEKGEIITDKNGRTGKPGVFAAGDVTDVEGKQVIIASGEGAKAALSAYSYLTEKKK